MTAIASSRGGTNGVALAVALWVCLAAGRISADAPALKLHAVVIAAAAAEAPLTLELFRWSTEAEREPFVAALTPPAAVPAVPPDGPGAPPAAAPAARGGRAGRGGRGAAPPPNPLARLTTAIKSSPTIGYIWSGGITGYSIKYAWSAASPDGSHRVVLAIDRRLGVHSTSWAPAAGGPADADFTVLELRLDRNGAGEAKASLDAVVVVDAAAKTLALDRYASVPALLKVTR